MISGSKELKNKWSMPKADMKSVAEKLAATLNAELRHKLRKSVKMVCNIDIYFMILYHSNAPVYRVVKNNPFISLTPLSTKLAHSLSNNINFTNKLPTIPPSKIMILNASMQSNFLL